MEKALMNNLIGTALRTEVEKSRTIEEIVSIERYLSAVYDFFVNSYAFPELELPRESRCLLAGKFESIYHECSIRVKGSDNPTAKAALLPIMYDFLRLPLLPLDNAKYQECNDICIRILEEKPMGYDRADWRVVHNRIRLTIELAEQMSPEEREKDHLYKRLKSVFATWARSMNPDGSWNDVPTIEALGRLELMNRNSYRVLDHTFNRDIASGYDYYKKRTESDVRVLDLLTALETCQSDKAMEPRFIQRIKEMAERRLTPGMDDIHEYRIWVTLFLNCTFHLVWDGI